jgi:hypothetical protein
MGAARGGLSYLRFTVDKDPPPKLVSGFEKAVEARRFMPLKGGELAESAGWAPIDDPLDDEAPIPRDGFMFTGLIALAYREDKIAIPKALLEHQVRRRMLEIEQSGQRVNRTAKKAIELTVAAELRRKTMPMTRLVDVVWDLRRGELRLFGRGKIATERATALFERTFSVQPRLAHYGVRAFDVDVSLRARAVLEQLAPEPWFGGAS